jgi:predicted ATP-grasp superfamily ATP-dependent carboligase
MPKKNILVFPCGSEVGLEIHRSLVPSTHFHLIGAGSIADHGMFVYEDYIGGLPMIHDDDVIHAVKRIVEERAIDAIFPAVDSAVLILKAAEATLGCKVVAPPIETVSICNSKKETYSRLFNLLSVPKIYSTLEEVEQFPVFIKPDVGYGSRNTLKAENYANASAFLNRYTIPMLICEYLPGPEMTVDCFTDRHGKLLFTAPRSRDRISNGIAVNSKTLKPDAALTRMANTINQTLSLSGSWFFQVKAGANGEYYLMEIGCRIAGTSGLHRMLDVNFAALSLYTAFDKDVEVTPNNINLEVDRALKSVCKIHYEFENIYVDLDDTLICDGKVNAGAVATLYHFRNQQKKIILLTKHAKNLSETLNQFRIQQLFDEIIHLQKNEQKADYIHYSKSIFIDDSFAERKLVKQQCNIPCFGVDALHSFM